MLIDDGANMVETKTQDNNQLFYLLALIKSQNFPGLIK